MKDKKPTYKSLKTVELLEMHEQKKDSTLFSSIPIDKKNLVENLNMIGWTHPDQPNPQKALNWLKSLQHD